MDYQKSKRQKRILGEGKGIKQYGSARRYQDQPGERPMAQSRVPETRQRVQPGERPMAQARVPERSTATNSNIKRQFENAFGSKATGGVKVRNSNTGNVTEQKTEQKKPSWYSGSKTKAKATVRGKNG